MAASKRYKLKTGKHLQLYSNFIGYKVQLAGASMCNGNFSGLNVCFVLMIFFQSWQDDFLF